MSAKEELAQAIEAIPDSATLEEAFDRLYLAFKDKLRKEAALKAGPSRQRPFGMDVGRGRIAPDFDAALPEELLQGFLGG